jgi:hypothetical protein
MNKTDQKKRTLTMYINHEDRENLDRALVHYRQRTGENMTAGKAGRTCIIKWADDELVKPIM